MEKEKIKNIMPDSVEEEGQKVSHGAEEKNTADQEPKNIREETIREAESKFIPPKLDELFPASFLEEHGIKMEEEENKVTFILPAHDSWIDSDGYVHPSSKEAEMILDIPLKWQATRWGDKVLWKRKFIFEVNPAHRSLEYKGDNNNKFHSRILKRLKAERAVEELGIGKEKEYPIADKVNYLIKVIEEKADYLGRNGEFSIFYDPEDEKIFIYYHFGAKKFDFRGRLERNWNLHFPSSDHPTFLSSSGAPRETITIYEEKYKCKQTDAWGEITDGKREILTDKKEEDIKKTKESSEKKQYKYYSYVHGNIEREVDKYYNGQRLIVDYSSEACKEFGTFCGQKVIIYKRSEGIIYPCIILGVLIEGSEKRLLLKKDYTGSVYSLNINELSERIKDGRVQFIAEEQNIMEQSPDKFSELKESEKEIPKAQEKIEEKKEE